MILQIAKPLLYSCFTACQEHILSLFFLFYATFLYFFFILLIFYIPVLHASVFIDLSFYSNFRVFFLCLIILLLLHLTELSCEAAFGYDIS